MEKLDLEQMVMDDVKYVWHHFNQAAQYSKHPLIIEKAEGCYYYDISGRRYLDAVSGVYVVNVGHGRKEVINAMKAQLDNMGYNCLIYSSSLPVIELAKKLAEIAPGDLEKIFFTTGGSEATETVIKMARQYHFLTGSPQKYRVGARWMSYHGATLAALGVTGHTPRRRFFQPLIPNFPHISPPYHYRCSYCENLDECNLQCAYELEKVVKEEGPETISAFMVEPIVGLTAGCLAPTKEYYDILRETCDKYNILLVADEIITGFGRTGKMFGCEHYDLKPDLMTIGKGIACGYAPIAGVMVTPKVAEAFEKGPEGAFQHGYTFSGHGLGAAAALECLKITERERLVERSATMGDHLLKELRSLDHRIIGDVRGKGLLAALELVRNRETKEIFRDDEPVGARVAEIALKNGVKVFGTKGFNTGMISDFVALAPPLIITKEEIDLIVNVLDRAIGEVEKAL